MLLWTRLESGVYAVQTEIPASLVDRAYDICGAGIGVFELDVQVGGMVGMGTIFCIGFGSGEC